ncbi:unnamed protein product [Nezara viridula]|uniref:Uncharacterized protein n=1 Tax=Nezara viridula TaxID=85310 RepID=A0A9P0H5E0_NEZVI|nr:unnamed protein product [Nezara viridula]
MFITTILNQQPIPAEIRPPKSYHQRIAYLSKRTAIYSYQKPELIRNKLQINENTGNS